MKRHILFFILFASIIGFAFSTTEISSPLQFKELIESEKIIVADFYATWCPPCKALGPVLEELSVEYGEKVEFVKINVDEQPELARDYLIESIPDVRIFKNQEQVKKIVGFRSKEDFKKILDEVLEV